MKPAVRLRLNASENVGNEVKVPTVKFKRKGTGKKSIVTIEFGLNEIGDIVEDSEEEVDLPTKEGFRDALLSKTNFAVPGFVKVWLVPGENIEEGTRLTFEVALSTKVPGTGAVRKLQNDEAKEKTDKRKK